MRRPAQRDRPAKLPADAVSVSVAPEAEQARRLAAVEPVDRVVQPRMGVDAATDPAADRRCDRASILLRTAPRINCCIAAGTRKCLTTMSPRDTSRRIEASTVCMRPVLIASDYGRAAGAVFEFRGLAACERRGPMGRVGCEDTSKVVHERSANEAPSGGGSHRLVGSKASWRRRQSRCGPA